MEQIDLKAILSQLNLRKQYAQLNEIMHQVNATELISMKKTLLFDLFSACFDDNLLIGASALEKLLKNLLLQQGDPKNTEQVCQSYTDVIYDSYLQAVENNVHNFNLNYSQQINRVLGDVRIESIFYLLRKLVSDSNYSQSKAKCWAIASNLRNLKANGLVDILDGKFVFKGPLQIDLSTDIVKNWMFNCKRAISFEAFQVYVLHSKTTAVPSQIEYESVFEFIQHCLKTSYPNFRKNYIAKFKFFFERIRCSYQKDFKLIEKQMKPKNNISELENFIKQTLNLLYSQLMPDCCFETSNPNLEIIKLIYHFLGNEVKFELKKGQKESDYSFLLRHCKQEAFSELRLESLLTQLQSNWESSRVLAYEILCLFPKNLEYMTEDKIKILRQKAINYIGSPIIKWYECGSFQYSFLIKKFGSIIYKEQNSLEQGIRYLIEDLKRKFIIFKKVFQAQDIATLSQNLIHGYICAFWVLIQRNNLKQDLTKDQLNNLFTPLLELCREVMEFATQVSSENICTWIIDDKSTSQSPYQVDCRGHFYQAEFVQNVQKVLQGNTLIQSLNEQEEGMTENVLVVSFFLITRESGVFFQELAKFIENSGDIIPKDSLKKITYQFFHALLNIKHLGSIDRIAQGLYDLCKTMSFSKDPQLPGLVDELLNKLIEAFDLNQLKNIFRRSSGLPHLVCCLIRSCDKKLKSKERVIELLMDYAQKGALEMRIHALNVLRKLFMESSLKVEMEPFITKSYMIAIDGFNYDDWSVRNSSLMLFSALTSRTLGRNNQNSDQISQKMTLIEFFAKYPKLIQFFKDRINEYSDDQLYPSLYPIALILSKLAPMEGRFVRKVQSQEINKKQMEDKKIDQLLPALINCLKNKNYLGRVIVSKSILPFLKFESIPQFAIDLLDKIPDTKSVKINHNNAHGILLLCLQLFKDYFAIKKMTIESYDQESLLFLKENELKFIKSVKPFLLTEIKCPPIKSVLIQILSTIMKNMDIKLDEYLNIFITQSQQELNLWMNQPNFIIQKDIFDSVLRKKQIRFLINFNCIYSQQTNYKYLTQILKQLLEKYTINKDLLIQDDLEILQIIFKLSSKVVKVQKSDIDLTQNTISILYKFLATIPLNYNLSQAIEWALKLILNSNKLFNIQNDSVTLEKILQFYKENGQIVKSIIKLFGYELNNNNQLFSQFLKLCQLYSTSNNIDDLRVAVIKSIKISINTLKKQQSIELSLIYLRLLQDENPEIRNLISKLLSQNIFGNNFSQRYNCEYLIDNFFKLVFEPNISDPQQAIDIIIPLLFESDFYLIKKQNHICKRIFQYEKSNKYYSELQIKYLAYIWLTSFNIDKLIIQQKLDKYLEQHPLQELQLKEIESYKQDIKDDYFYETLLNIVIAEELKKKTQINYQQSPLYIQQNIKDLESSFQLFVE